MTQKEKLMAVLTELGVTYEIGATPGGTCLYIEGGYAHFYTQIEFDAQGQFLKWGSYE